MYGTMLDSESNKQKAFLVIITLQSNKVGTNMCNKIS